MNKTLVAVGILVLLAFVGGVYFKGFTGNVIFGEGSHNYTKVICQGDQCLNVYVECFEGNAIVTPITPYSSINTTQFVLDNKISC